MSVAGDTPTGNLSVTVFRYQNDTNFYTPRYVWDTLASVEITPSEISQAFEVIRVPVNANVAKGDKLGIALVSASVTPMCVLVTGGDGKGWIGARGINLRSGGGGGDGRTIFAIGANQVSFRGPQGKTPPIVVLPGQIKWYSIMG